LPTDKLVVAPLEALPPDRATAAPKLVPSILNWTVPLGVPAAGEVGLTVALKVTLWPNLDGLTDELTEVLVAPCWTVWVRSELALLVKLVLPLYAALMAWSPTLKVEVLVVAWPPLMATGLPATPSIVKVTVPLGVPDAGAVGLTAAVKVTLWPNLDGLAEELTAVVVAPCWTVWVRPALVLPLKFVSDP
jgi:hypothetical protein